MINAKTKHRRRFFGGLYGAEPWSLDRFLLEFAARDAPVILLEGTRSLPAGDRPMLVSLGRTLAERMPRAIFRTGGATGSDEAFAEGVQEIDPRRLEYVLPRRGHRAGERHNDSPTYALETIGTARERTLVQQTSEASPEYGRLVDLFAGGHREGGLAAKTRYLLRDTLKVGGAPELGLRPAAAGVFYVHEASPLAGGTGHTIRVCHRLAIPVFIQSQWRVWVMG